MILTLINPLQVRAEARPSQPNQTEQFAPDRNPHAPTSIHHGPAGYANPTGLASGATFIDRILPMPPGTIKDDVWGAAMTGPRNVDNGLEDPAWSYWCSTVHRNPATGKYEMIVSRWAENSPKGHMSWPDSTVIYAVADAACGPYRVVGKEIGKGHNAWVYQAKDGRWVQYFIRGGRIASQIAGPWKSFDIIYDRRGVDGGPMTNHTFTRREDGSVLMLSRGGRTWISPDGIQPFRLIANQCPYPSFPGAYEDPCVWRDEVQYNMIVNDWYGRQAYYLRSLDGVNWVLDEGLAYTPHIVRQADGTQEKWFKLERPFVLQDEYGRATHLFLAAIDTLKLLDQPNDSHSSKVLVLPLRVQRRLEVLPTPADKPLQLRLHAEPGFLPLQDVDAASLRFGSPRTVDYGGGAAPTATHADGQDLILTFARADISFTAQDFAAKLLGQTNNKQPLFGFVRLPGVDFQPALLSLDGLRVANNHLIIGVENSGLKTSVPRPLRLRLVNAKNNETISRTFLVPALAPYQRHEITFDLNDVWRKPQSKLVAELPDNGKLTSHVELDSPAP